MSPIAENSLMRLELCQPLAVQIFKGQGTPPVGREAVQLGDLADVASEAWRDGCLRAGHPEAPLTNVPMRLWPVFTKGSDKRCAGFKVELTLPNGKTTQRVFTLSCLRHVAERATTRLLEAGALKLGESTLFGVVANEAVPARIGPPENGIAVTVSVRSAPLTYLRVSLRQLLERATAVALGEHPLTPTLSPSDGERENLTRTIASSDGERGKVFPIFYTREAFEKAEACARRGAEAGVESGGALAACAESGEFLAIIHDVIEIQEAEQKKFSLSYSSRSWQRLQKIQQARQAAFPERAERLIGQTHGHPFRPNDGKLCVECEKRASCTLTSAWVSQDDELWHKAVFARQPFCLCHIFGLSARGEPVDQLFGLQDGRLQARGYYLLPDFAFD